MKKIRSYINDLKNSKLLVCFLCFAVLIFSIILYRGTLSYNISGMDDDSFIRLTFDKYTLKDVFIKNAFLDDTIKTYYRPLLTLSFMIDNRINKSPAVMHSVNVLLHGVCGMLLFIFLRRYFFSRAVSFLAVLFFVSHPVNIFSAAWIPGRNDLMLCLFFLLSLIFLFEYLKKDKKIFLLFHFISFAFALFTKEISVIFPLVYVLESLKIERLEDWKKKVINKRFLIILFTHFVMVTAFLILYKSFSYNVFKPSQHFAVLRDNLKIIFDYYSAAYLFNIHFTKYFFTASFVLGIISVILSFIFVYFSNLKLKEKLLYFIFPAVMMTTALIAGQMFFQGSRVYIPLIFMLIPFVSFLQKYFNRNFVCIVLAVLTAVSAYMTLNYQKVFENEITYFGTIDKEMPNYEIVMANLYSYNLLKYGKFKQGAAKAREIYEVTKHKNPYNKYVLSIVNMHEKKYDKAVEFLLQITDFDNDVYTKLVVCYDKLGDMQKSLYYYKILLNLNNNDRLKTNELIRKEQNVLPKN